MKSEEKKIGIALASVVLLAALASVSIGTASAETIYVPNDYTNIQWAVDNATAGDTIIVRDGTYNENVDVDKHLTIRSENGSDSTIVQAAYSNDHVFNITTDYVNISGFTIDKGNSGVYAYGIDSMNVSCCNFEGQIDGLSLYGTCSNITIEYSYINGSSNSGIHKHVKLDGLMIRNTVINNSGLHGIQLTDFYGYDYTRNVSIIDTKVMNSGSDGIYVYTYTNSKNIRLENTSVTDCNGDGIHLYDVKGEVVVRNITSSRNSNYGLYVDGVTVATLLNLTVTENGNGVFLQNLMGCTPFNVSYNAGTQVYLSSVSNVTVRLKADSAVKPFNYGVYLGGDGAYGMCSNITIEDSYINGSSLSGIYKHSYAKLDGLMIRNMEINNSGRYGIGDDYSYYYTKNVSIIDTKVTNAWDGIYIYNKWNTNIENIRVDNTSVTDCHRYGIHLYRVKGEVVVTNITSSRNGYYGLYVDGDTVASLNNLTVTGNRNGVYLENLRGCTPFTVSDNVEKQVHLRSVSNVTLRIKTDSATFGVYIDGTSNNITIEDSYINGSSMSGIYKYGYANLDGITIRNTVINNSRNPAILILDLLSDYYTKNVSIKDTKMMNSSYGIHVNMQGTNSENIRMENISVTNCYGNGIELYNISGEAVVTNNTIETNDKGIYLYGVANGTFTNNNILNNTYGIYLSSSNHNLIYNNYFNNTKNAYDCGNNAWNITKTNGTNIIGGLYLGGNYWKDYSGIDLDGDELGDTAIPYNSSNGIQNGGDYLPLVTSPIPLVLDESYTGNISMGEWQLFRVDIEADKNLVITLEPESQNGTLELYSKFGDVPTQYDYDLLQKRKNAFGNYELLISPTKKGVYVLGIYGSDIEDTMDYNLTASLVDRYVYDIYPNVVANSTDVKIHIQGAGFTNGMKVELQKDVSSIPAQTVIYSSPLLIIAKFNLSSALPGRYDISIIWPDEYEKKIEAWIDVTDLPEGLMYSSEINITEGDIFIYNISVPEIDDLFITLQKTIPGSGYLSLLYEGEEIACHSGYHDHILHVMNLEPGYYTIAFTANYSGKGIFNVRSSLPELYLGKWIVGTVYRSYGSTWYQVEVPTNQDILYFEAEAMGMKSYSNIYYSQYGSPDHWRGYANFYLKTTIEIPNPSPGRYIVQFTDSANILWSSDQNRDILLKVDTKESVSGSPGYLPIISFSTYSGGNAGLVTAEIKGKWLNPNANVSLIRAGYEDIFSHKVKGNPDQTNLKATFDLANKNPGDWRLIVKNPDGQNATAPFTINEGGKSNLWVELVGRDKIRAGRPGRYILRYGNSGDINMPAPLFVISTSADALLSLNGIEYETQEIKIIGEGFNESKGILHPGSSFSVPIYLYYTYLGEIPTKASALSASPVFEIPILTNVQDAFCPCSGITLEFNRARFQDSYLGPLGYGWVHNYDIHLEELNDGTIVLSRGNSYNRYFLCNGDDTYTAIRDYGNLTRNPDDTFLLKEKDGTIYGFRTDFRLDYLEDTNGNRINAVYNTNDQLIELQHSCGESFSLEYHDDGRISRLIDHTGRETEYQYDGSRELLMCVTTPAGMITDYSYISNGENPRLTSISYPENVQQLFEYDGNGRLSEVFLDSNEELIRYSYDLTNKTTYITDADGNVAKIHVDEFGQINWLENPLGAVAHYKHDVDFNLIQQTDPLGNSFYFSYDEHGNIISVTNSLNHEITMEYNLSFNKLTWLQDTRGNEITFDFNEHGNVLSITHPDSSTESMDYDSAGNLINETTRKGDVINCNYNDRGQLIRKDYPDGSWVAYGYDDAGNMISATDESGTISMEYNTRDLLTGLTYQTGYFFNYSYDDAGRLHQRVDQDGKALNYEYDAASRLVYISNESYSDIVRYEYDVVGRLSKKTLGSGAYTIYEYDAADQILCLINHNASGGVLSRFDYTYDLMGNPVSITTLEGTYNYEYDSIGQLTKVIYPNGHIVSYSYDQAGNRIAVVDDGVTTTYTTNNMNQYTEVGNVSYSYDANGNLISKTVDGQTTNYEYNFENRLSRVTSPEGTWEYTYDALGNRVGMVYNGIEHRYLIDLKGFGNVVAEYNGDDNLIARYIHGLGLISQIDSSGNQYYYHFNPTGHTTEITDRDGNVVNSYKYSPFDVCLENENISNSFKYVGKLGVMDDDNGLNYMRARYYLPKHGRFSSEDPVRVPGENQYVYVENSPILLVDPYGDEPLLPHDFVHGLTLRSRAIRVHPFEMGKTGEAQGMLNIGNELIQKGAREFTINVKTSFIYSILVYPLTVFQSVKVLSASYDCYNSLNTMYELKSLSDYEVKGIEHSIYAVTSSTPEDKYGPTGFDHPGTPPEERKRFVPADQNYYYKIDFWNKEDATAPACDVYVKDQLDTKHNWSTFRFGEIGFLNWTVELEPCQYFNVYVDTRPEMDLIVNVEGTFDTGTGGINWTFRSLDPVTLETPQDPMVGFLPPITGSGYEIGWVCFSVEAESGLSTGTQIRNQAFVNFDGVGPFNPAPKEGPFTNIIDAGKPSSSVTATVVNLTEIHLNITGTDDAGGSGISDYSIYVSEDGGNYVSWLDHIVNDKAIVYGLPGRTYAFYSVARDNAGNLEETPEEPDATVVCPITAPVAIFTFTPKTPFANQLIAFNASSSYDPDGFIREYKWDFGDGHVTETTGSIITHSYASAGEYIVNLTVTDDDGATNTSVQGIAVSSMPDLVITENWVCWPDNCTICYNVTNVGNETVPAGHNTTLFVDNVEAANDHVAVALEPNESYIGCFDDYNWTYTPPSDNITVCADSNNTVAESNETNNCMFNTWKCGDVDGNGIVNILDVRLLMNHVANPTGYPVESWAGDVDGEGDIDGDDVQLLLAHVFDPEAHPLKCRED